MNTSSQLNVVSGFKTEIIYLDETFRITGPQLMSDRCVRMTCKYRNDGGPARFIVGNEIIPATVDYIVDHNERGLTSVGNGRAQVKQTEHILSALCGMSVLDTDIHLEYEDGGSVDEIIAPPVAQLNSREFSHAIMSCFLSRNLQQPAKAVDINRSYVFHEEQECVRNGDPGCAIFAPLHKLHITAQINFPIFWGKQIYSQTITPLDYARSICWARSFFSTPYPHSTEWETLRAKYPALLRESENHFRSLMIDYTETEWITPVVVNTEPVRHKMLDFIGELALLGVPIRAGIHIYKPSHRFNKQCMIQLATELGLKV